MTSRYLALQPPEGSRESGKSVHSLFADAVSLFAMDHSSCCARVFVPLCSCCIALFLFRLERVVRLFRIHSSSIQFKSIHSF